MNESIDQPIVVLMDLASSVWEALLTSCLYLKQTQCVIGFLYNPKISRGPKTPGRDSAEGMGEASGPGERERVQRTMAAYSQVHPPHPPLRKPSRRPLASTPAESHPACWASGQRRPKERPWPGGPKEPALPPPLRLAQVCWAQRQGAAQNEPCPERPWLPSLRDSPDS